MLFVFQYLLRTGVQAYERGEELAKRTRELASLQVGLLTTVLQTLSMRDAMTARHSAAVARYSREVAEMLGSRRARAGPDPHGGAASRHRQVHLPGLDPLRRPQAHRRRVGDRQAPSRAGREARRRIEGYGPVADIIYCHHERYDGNGYYGVPLEQIPLGSRIIAAADTYDVMTSRDSYRRPVSSEAALASSAASPAPSSTRWSSRRSRR